MYHLRKSQVDTLSPEEIQFIKRNTPQKVSLFFETLHRTGCRISELLNVQMRECVRQGEFIRLKVRGKKGKVRYVFLKRSKFRTICAEFGSREYLFQGRVSRPITRQYLARELKKTCSRAHPHLFRHTRITEWLQKHPIDAVARAAGHHSPAFTLEVYGANILTREDMIDMIG